ncbi:MAG TPA: hypothetical protein VGM54_23625 [Chthoniobacter sp.]|jgi:hypothetical protein
MRTFRRILGVLLIFLFGVFVGAVVTGAGITQKIRELVLGGPEAVINVVVKRLDRELKLDDEQKRKLQVIVDDARIRLRQSHAKVQPEVEQTLRDAEDRTRAILYPNQVKKFDELVAKSRERWKTAEGELTPTPAPSTPAPEKPSAPEPSPTGTPAPAPATPAPAGINDGK